MNSSSSQKIHSPTFNEIMSAVNQVREICDKYETIPKSEIYNETWMLRLTLALMKEIDIEQLKRKGDHISEVCRAVRSGWISEGGLKPVFKREHATWTDAILGRICFAKNGRNVEIKGSDLLEDDEYKGVIVIEAKMASELSRRVKDSQGYDQAARNIACLSRLIVASNVKDVPLEQVHFYVFAPKSKIEEWNTKKKKANGKKKECNPEAMIKDAVKTIEQQQEVSSEHCNSREFYFSSDEERDSGIITIDAITEKAKTIVGNSEVISWESILKLIKCHLYAHKDSSRLLTGYYEDIVNYYKITKKIYGIIDDEIQNI